MGQLGALTYGRQSLGKDISIAQQLELGRKRTANEGWHHAGEYSDKVSASRYTTKTRDDWAKLLAELGNPAVDVLWLWETSRGDRRAADWLAMLDTCRTHNVGIFVETHGRMYDVRNARDWRTLAEDGIDNAYESEKISLRTRRSADARAAEGRPHSGACYGFANLHDERTGKFTERVIEPSEAVNVAELFTRLRQGHSLRSIERDWDARGIRTRTGKRFVSQHLRDMALTPSYTALRVHLTSEQRKADKYTLDGATEGTWEPIIDRETFYAVREMLLNPARTTRRPGRAVHLLSVNSAAVCDVCGGPLCAGMRRDEWTLFCKRSTHVRVLESELDEIAERQIIAYLSRPDNYAAFTRPADGAELAQVRAQLAQVRAQRAELPGAIKRGMSIPTATAVDADLGRRIITLESRERELSAPDELRGLIEPGADVAARWAAAPISARREVARIVLSPNRVGVIKVQKTRAGQRVPASERVTLHRA